MKKVTSFLILFAVLFSFAGCRSRNEFTVKITYLCDETAYAACVEYGFGNIEAGGQRVSLSPQNDVAFRNGDVLTFTFKKADFPEDAELSSFRLVLYLLSEDGTETEATSFGIAARYGDTYAYSLHYDAERGYLLRRD